MLSLNPLVKSYQLLPPSSAIKFFASEVAGLTPPDPEKIPVYQVIEGVSGSNKDGGEGGTGEAAQPSGGSWRGGWASRFVPDAITYETSMEKMDDGLRSITHAPMGVHSCTTWVVREGEEGEVGDGEVLVLEEKGRVTSNRMLMAFIKTTLQESHDKLVRDFVALLEREVASEGAGGVTGVEKVS